MLVAIKFLRRVDDDAPSDIGERYPHSDFCETVLSDAHVSGPSADSLNERRLIDEVIPFDPVFARIQREFEACYKIQFIGLVAGKRLRPIGNAFRVAQPSLLRRVPIQAPLASWYLKSEPDQKARGKVFQTALSQSAGLAVPGILIGLDIDRRAKGKDEDEQLFDDSQLDAAKAAWVTKLTRLRRSEPEAAIRGHHLINYLYRWKEFDGVDGPFSWLATTANNPKLLPLLLRVFVHEGRHTRWVISSPTRSLVST